VSPGGDAGVVREVGARDEAREAGDSDWNVFREQFDGAMFRRRKVDIVFSVDISAVGREWTVPGSDSVREFEPASSEQCSDVDVQQ
jgi:hypothetical protein